MPLLHRRLAVIAAAAALVALLHSGASWAGVEVNQATEAQLDGIKGIGPATSGRILHERGKRPFADWPDLIARVRGIGSAAARRLSAEGVTVDGAAYPGPPRQTGPGLPGLSDRSP